MTRSVHLLLTVVAVLLSAAVAALVAIGELSVVTGLLFLLSAGCWIILAARLALRLTRFARLATEVTLTLAATTVAVCAAELILRGTGQYASYTEANGGRRYLSPYDYANTQALHVYAPNHVIRETKIEFHYERRTNSLGLAEREIDRNKGAGEFRIIALGDSFTEGVGASYDETWVKVFERELPPLWDGRRVKAINGGIAGSDVLFELALLRERLAPYAPDLVIMAINSSDVTDVVTRGGRERLQGAGAPRRTGPRWKWLYGISYITRHILHGLFGYTYLLMPEKQVAAAEAAAVEELRSAIGTTSAFAATLGARFVLVFHPHEIEVTEGRYRPPAFHRLMLDLTGSRAIVAIDLLKRYMESGIVTPANSREFYWKLDYHHNARGYRIMGEAIASEVARRGVLDSRANGP